MIPASKRLTVREKLFVEGLHQGKRVLQAYKDAGYAPSTWEPYTVYKRPKIQAHLRRLEERALKKHDVTVEKILTDLERQKEKAERVDQMSAAINATMSQAKIVGLVVDKRETKEVSEMDMTELVNALKEEFGENAGAVMRMLGVEEKKEEWKDFPATGTVQ